MQIITRIRILILRRTQTITKIHHIRNTKDYTKAKTRNTTTNNQKQSVKKKKKNHTKKTKNTKTTTNNKKGTEKKNTTKNIMQKTQAEEDAYEES